MQIIICVRLIREIDENCSWMPDLLERCEVPLDLSLGCRRPTGFLYNRENILLHGDLGSGKTTICEILIERYRNSPCFAYTHMISCKSLQGNICDARDEIFS